MKRRQSGTQDVTVRARVAEEAARIMIEQGIRDFAQAKRKAAERLRLSSRGVLPSNAMIEERLAARQRIFESEDHHSRVAAKRQLALEVMDVLADFQPRLVGTVLNGTATLNCAVELHAFSDEPELVSAELARSGWETRSVERRSRRSRSETVRVPAYRFVIDTHDLVVEVHPCDGIRQAPLSPIDQRPMRRAARKTVEELLAET
ncbi:MAG: hypothetical protein PVF63_10325 [Gammaproteobacteria bacterium]